MHCDRVKINVSGLAFETYERTLRKFPKTLLGSERKRYYYDERNNEYFFNRNRQVFHAVLFYYQSDGILSKPSNIPEKIFREELNFFNIDMASNEKSVADRADSFVLGQEQLLPKDRFRRKMWLLLFRPNSSSLANYIEVLSIFILLISVLISCLESMPIIIDLQEREKKLKQCFAITDHICYGWFTLEYITRCLFVRDKLKYIKSWLSVVDLMTIVPFYFQLAVEGSTINTKLTSLRILRLLRVARLLKITRYNRGMRALLYTLMASMTELTLYLVVALLLNVFSASLMYFFEGHDKDSLIDSIPQAMWWGVNTFTTVGYGDTYPVTGIGKLLGAICSVIGIIFLGVPVYCLVSNFIMLWEAMKSDEADDLASKFKNSVRKIKSEWVEQSRKFRRSFLRNRQRINFKLNVNN